MQYLSNIDLVKNQLLNARIQNLAADPQNAVEGQVYHNTVDHKLKVYNGTTWEYVGSVVTDPVTGDGKITIDGVEYTVYALPTASTTTLGGVKVGAGLTIDANGELSFDSVNNIMYTGEFTHSAISIAELKAEVYNASVSNRFEDHGWYHGFLSSFQTPTFSGNVEFSILLQSTQFPIILFWSKNGHDDQKNRAWFCYAGTQFNEATSTNIYTNDVYQITNEVFASDLTALNAVIDADYVHTDNNFTDALISKLNGIAAGAEVNVQADWSTSDTSSDSYILNKPTALSDFTNDENFIDNTVENLVNYYTKTETYTQTEVNTLIGQLATIQISVVDNLPNTGASNIIYLIPKVGGSAPNAKDEYLWTGNTFEKIGDTEIDLSNYLTRTGDTSNTTVAFTIAGSRTLPTSAESMAVLIGKITKYLTDLKTVAFTGSYADLINRPRDYIMKNIILNHNDTTGFIESDVVPIAVEAHDGTTGEFVMVDYAFMPGQNPSGITISIASAYANAIIVTAIFPVAKSAGDTFND